jgi:hypothetical protein
LRAFTTPKDLSKWDIFNKIALTKSFIALKYHGFREGAMDDSLSKIGFL